MEKVQRNFRLSQEAFNQIAVIQDILKSKGLRLNNTQVIEYLLMRGQDNLLDERDHRNMILDKEVF